MAYIPRRSLPWQNVVRHTHYRTWLFGKAVPVCDPRRKTKAAKNPTSADLDKVTCPRCKEAVETGGTSAVLGGR